MENCIFCKIVKGEAPSQKVMENDEFMAFMNIFPYVKGQILVIPKKHYRWVYDVPNFGAYWEFAREVAMKVQKAFDSKYISFLTVGEAVEHAHIHIMPQSGNGIEGFSVTPVLTFSQEELAEVAEKVRKAGKKVQKYKSIKVQK